MTMKYQRQVDRVCNYNQPFNRATRDNAAEQLRSAWVLHVDAAIASLKRDIKKILRLRCAYCGHHHLYKPYVRHWGGGSWEHCDYGWWFSIRLIFKKAYFHLWQGTD